MSTFAGVSWAAKCRVVDYGLFCTGVVAIILADVTNRVGSKGTSRGKSAIAFIVTACLGFVLAPHLSSLVIVFPAALGAVLITDSVTIRRKTGDAAGGFRKEAEEDPVADLVVSLPSAVALVAILTLA